jgi:hypothetical protein
MAEPLKTGRQRLQSLVALNCIRSGRVLETIQYSAVFALIALVVGVSIDRFFAQMYPTPSRASAGKMVYTYSEALKSVLYVVLQVCASAVAVIYIRKVGDLVPFLFNPCPEEYIPHWKVKEVEGEMALSLVFVGVQTSIMEHLGLLRASTDSLVFAKSSPKGRSTALAENLTQT